MMQRFMSMLAIGVLVVTSACSRPPVDQGRQMPAATGTYIGDGWARQQPEPSAPGGLALGIGQPVLVGPESQPDQHGNIWHLVRQDEKAGWVPASHLVLSGQDLAAAVHNRCRQILSSTAGDVESMAAATSQYQSLLALIPGPQADAPFRAWRETLMELLPTLEASAVFHRVAAYVIAGGEDVMADPGLIPDPEVRRGAGMVLAAGYTVKMSEGLPYLAINPGVLQAFASSLSEPLAAFVRMLAARTARPAAADAALMIPWDEVRARAMAAEAWLRENPGLPEAAEVETWMQNYMWIYLRGLDNSPIFPFGSDRLDPQLQASYGHFLEENRDSRFYQQVEEFYRLLEEHNFRATPQVRAFMRRTWQ